MKIGRFSPSFSLLSALQCQEDFRDLFSNSSPTVINELNNCFIEKKSTRMITQVEWPRGMDFFTLRSSSSTINKSELQEGLDEDGGDQITRQVKVRTMNLEWLYRDRLNFINFCTMLEDLPSPVYSSEFIACLLD